MNVRGLVLTTAFALAISAAPANAMKGPPMQGEPGKDMKDAMMLVDARKYADAQQKLSQILRQDAQNPDAWNLLGFSSRMQGDFDKAEKAYTNALKLSPNHVGALNYMGQMYVQTGRLDEARTMLARLKGACGDCTAYAQLETAIREGKAGNY